MICIRSFVVGLSRFPERVDFVFGVLLWVEMRIESTLGGSVDVVDVFVGVGGYISDD